MFNILKDGKKPIIKTMYSSSADLCARTDLSIMAGETKVIPLGVKIDLDYFKNMCTVETFDNSDYSTVSGMAFDFALFEEFLLSHFFELKIRSGLSSHLIIANGVGEIDLDYPDEIGLKVHNPVKMENIEILSQLISIKGVGMNNGDSKKNIDKATKIFLEKSPHTDKLAFKIKAGEPVAQIKLMEHKNNLMPEEYRKKEIRKGGFGSTDK